MKMATELVTMQQTTEMAGHFVKSGLFKDVNDVSKAIVKIICGRELGFSEMASMMGVHIISGKLVLSSALISAKIKGSTKYDYVVKEWSETLCSLEIYEGERVIGLSNFSWDDAKRAKLTGKDVWQNYPRNMLFARAISNAARVYTPDLFGGVAVYSEGEIEEPVVHEYKKDLRIIPESKPLPPEQKIIELTGLDIQQTVELVHFAGKDYPADEVVGPERWKELVSPVVNSLNTNNFERDNSLKAHSFPRPADRATWGLVAEYTDYKLIQKSEPRSNALKPDGLASEDLYLTWVEILTQAGLTNAAATLALAGVAHGNILKLNEPLERLWSALENKMINPASKQAVTAIIKYLSVEARR
jgi:hypothetical protein